MFSRKLEKVLRRVWWWLFVRTKLRETETVKCTYINLNNSNATIKTGNKIGQHFYFFPFNRWTVNRAGGQFILNWVYGKKNFRVSMLLS